MIKRKFIYACLVCLVLAFYYPLIGQEISFSSFFTDDTMRIDYFHTGNSGQEEIALDRVYRQKGWAGSITRFLDPFNRGRYLVKIYDKASGSLIFSKGFDSFFGEYKTTTPAINGQKKTCHESVLIPFPQKPVRFVLETADRNQNWQKIFETEIDPADMYVVIRDLPSDVKVYPVINNGDPHHHFDLGIVAEGYTASQEAKVKADFERFARILINAEPYKSLKEKINVFGLFRASNQSGCLEPGYGRYPDTVIGASFDTFGTDRYVLVENNKAIQDIAAANPVDAIVIMINQSRYGGGGIYRLYATFCADNQWHEYLLLHEFGHSFTGLADEYYTSSVAYNDFYPKGVEPNEPNITALLDPLNMKWKALVGKKTPVPTPWKKELFDNTDLELQKVRRQLGEKIAAMKRENRPETEIAELQAQSEKLSLENAKKMDALLRQNKFFNKVGAFEGAGYSSKGLFRPELDCLMFTKGNKPLCRVCQESVRQMILFYSK